MWPFKKKKTQVEELADVVAKVGEIILWMQQNECYPPAVVEGLKNIMADCIRIQKQIEEDEDFNQRYYHK